MRTGILYLLLLIGLLNSCVNIGDDDSVEYHIIIDKGLLQNESFLDSIEYLFVDGLGRLDKNTPYPNEMSGIHIISGDSIGTVDLLQMSWFNKVAGSTPSWGIYLSNIIPFLRNKGLNEIVLEKSEDDNLEKILDVAYVISYPLGRPHSDVTLSGVKAIPDHVALSAQTENLIVIELKELVNAEPEMPTDAELKKLTYNTLRRWYENLETLYIKSKNESTKEISRSYVLDVCIPGATIEIQNKKGTKGLYTVEEFLDRITSNDGFQYDDVSFFMKNYKVLKSFEAEKIESGEISEDLFGKVEFEQKFTGERNGYVVYEDIVDKQIELVAKPVLVGQVEEWRIFIKSVTVVSETR